MTNLTIAILPLVGVVLGATLQFWLSRTADREKNADALRSQAYADYLRAVAVAGHLRSDQDLRDAHLDAADAKARIAIYGSAQVINALSRFEEAGAVITEGPSAQAFVSVVSSMRADSNAVTNRELEILLLGTSQRDDTSRSASCRR